MPTTSPNRLLFRDQWALLAPLVTDEWKSANDIAREAGATSVQRIRQLCTVAADKGLVRFRMTAGKSLFAKKLDTLPTDPRLSVRTPERKGGELHEDQTGAAQAGPAHEEESRKRLLVGPIAG